MLQRRCVAISLAFLLLARLAYAREPVELSWKFNKGDKFLQEVKTKTVQTTRIMNQEVKQEQEQTFVFSGTVLDLQDGNTVIEQKIEAVMTNIKIGTSDIK